VRRLQILVYFLRLAVREKEEKVSGRCDGFSVEHIEAAIRPRFAGAL